MENLIFCAMCEANVNQRKSVQPLHYTNTSLYFVTALFFHQALLCCCRFIFSLILAFCYRFILLPLLYLLYFSLVLFFSRYFFLLLPLYFFMSLQFFVSALFCYHGFIFLSTFYYFFSLMLYLVVIALFFHATLVFCHCFTFLFALKRQRKYKMTKKKKWQEINKAATAVNETATNNTERLDMALLGFLIKLFNDLIDFNSMLDKLIKEVKHFKEMKISH